MTERHLRTMKIDSHLSPPPSMGEGLPCGVSSATPQGKGGGGPPNRIPPHLNPLPPRGEEVFFGVIFQEVSNLKWRLFIDKHVQYSHK
jgi:hypothetical protein